MNLTRIAWSYRGCANMNSLHKRLRKLSSDRQTDRQIQTNRPKL